MKFCIYFMQLKKALLFAATFAVISFPALGLEAFRSAKIVAEATNNLRQATIEPTKLSRDNYLNVVSGIVNYFQHFQAEDGRIVDPYLQTEFQYSTPCYAWAAAALVQSGKQTNLLESATRALHCALQELAEDKAAMNHGDFFTFPCMLAYEALHNRVPPSEQGKIDDLLKRMDPQRCYQDVLSERHTTVHNWNVVALSGEFLRFQNGFTDINFVEKYLPLQLPYFTSDGLYRDPNMPMAYDHFPRHFLAAMLARGYNGKSRADVDELVDRGAWVSLLLQSPCGELPTGGRSAQHQWNEAEQCVTYEVWANRKRTAGDIAAAEAFKRAAHLGLQSIQRWVRPSGELWIVKNRFDPAVRHGFQSYSSHSQYNLLAASMLATAWSVSDETINEGPCPADVGGFVLEVPEFHKLIANAGGMYVEIDTAADPEYNSTGLIRVHKTGVEPLIGPTDSSPIAEQPLALGIAWRETNGWQSLASLGMGKIKGSELKVSKMEREAVNFSVTYKVGRPPADSITEMYDISPEQVHVTSTVNGAASEVKVRLPAFVFDGQQATRIEITNATVAVGLNNSREVFEIDSAKTAAQRTGELIRCRNGFLEPIEVSIPGKRVTYTIRPEKLRGTASNAVSIDGHQSLKAPVAAH